MCLEAACGHDAACVADDLRHREPLLPMTVGLPDDVPFAVWQCVEHNHLRAKLAAQAERIFGLHHFARVAHATAIAYNQGPSAHGFELAHESNQGIDMRRTRRSVGAVEIRLDEQVFAAEALELQQIDSASDPCGAVGGLHEGDLCCCRTFA